MRRQSLKFKITIYLTVALTAALFLFSQLLIPNQREEILQQSVNHVNQLSEVVIKSTRFALLQNQPSYVDQIIRDVGPRRTLTGYASWAKTEPSFIHPIRPRSAR